MRWSDLPLNPSARTLRQFAVLWMLFFGVIAAWNGFVRGHEFAATVLALLAVTIGPIGLVVPAAIRPIFVAWVVLGFPIGWTVSRVLLLVMFFGVILPVAMLFRVRGRDALRLSRPSGDETWWLPKPMSGDTASYFRQY